MQYGLAGFVIYLTIKEIFKFVKGFVDNEREPGKSVNFSCSSDSCPLKEHLSKIHDRVNALYEMHNQYDNDRSPKWYVKASLYDNVVSVKEDVRDVKRDLDQYIDTQNTTMGLLNANLKSLNGLLRKVEKE